MWANKYNCLIRQYGNRMVTHWCINTKIHSFDLLNFYYKYYIIIVIGKKRNFQGLKIPVQEAWSNLYSLRCKRKTSTRENHESIGAQNTPNQMQCTIQSWVWTRVYRDVKCNAQSKVGFEPESTEMWNAMHGN